jgi:hypothetical protein
MPPTSVITPQVFSKKFPDDPSMPNNFGTCPIMIVSAQADDEARQHPLGDERRQETETDQAEQDRRDARTDRQRSSEGSAQTVSPAMRSGRIQADW